MSNKTVISIIIGIVLIFLIKASRDVALEYIIRNAGTSEVIAPSTAPVEPQRESGCLDGSLIIPNAPPNLQLPPDFELPPNLQLPPFPQQKYNPESKNWAER